MKSILSYSISFCLFSFFNLLYKLLKNIFFSLSNIGYSTICSQSFSSEHLECVFEIIYWLIFLFLVQQWLIVTMHLKKATEVPALNTFLALLSTRLWFTPTCYSLYCFSILIISMILTCSVIVLLLKISL